ncbi:hypothetical protein DL95DRAFT_1867 [Leptodontidium sp. 2 PMI_412]|nr:hypothetical protein BKA61DRAFT_108575 [Leptodontidium sp. MPI-SDFR-AT-0119]KAH9224565.1 hypothetical protein DL95DRAFT_1867 [Leptodontidium sp. 2 PMI_412]
MGLQLTGMEPPGLSARLRYLNESAHLLATTSPTTSRYLMSRHNALMYDSKIELSESQKKKACGACGTIMILGWEATLQSEVRSRKGKAAGNTARKEREAARHLRTMVYTCGTCSKKTQFPTSISKPIRRNKAALPSTSTSTAPTLQSQASEANTPSKKAPKRKSRKKGVLEAILARNQAPQATSSGFGLDLSDFMKKS